jgi:hypothetical protein
LSASWVALAVPKTELMLSKVSSASFRGWITRDKWTFFSVAEIQQQPQESVKKGAGGGHVEGEEGG